MLFWAIGGTVRHSAGCVWNDINDRKIDRLVGTYILGHTLACVFTALGSQSAPRTDRLPQALSRCLEP